jgi:ribosomal protein L11 methylase PrmA
LGLASGGGEPHSSLVDIGSGTGRVVFYATHLGCSAIGFDIDDLVVRCSYHARQHLMKTDASLLKAPAVPRARFRSSATPVW